MQRPRVHLTDNHRAAKVLLSRSGAGSCSRDLLTEIPGIVNQQDFLPESDFPYAAQIHWMDGLLLRLGLPFQMVWDREPGRHSEKKNGMLSESIPF